MQEAPYKYEKKKVKTVNITLEDGRVFQIDAHKIAHDKATHYMDDDQILYQEEYECVIRDQEDLREWMLNNMNWYELEPVQVGQVKFKDLKDCEISETNYTSEGNNINEK